MRSRSRGADILITLSPMDSRPLIGITSDFIADKSRYALAYDYVTAVERAGGLPLMLPFQVDHGLIPQLVDTLDGIIFSGGDDLDPSQIGRASCRERVERTAGE